MAMPHYAPEGRKAEGRGEKKKRLERGGSRGERSKAGPPKSEIN